ncbi:dnaJ homolog subfamily C member 16-like [Pollicipes pollicipes]|uniref:dnaJ homolog subfamily C member 16-like n=1 Tax=Pollicipes pollicipes TaxID=41117 RepID=UPI0018858785|nr:dnaJ homolog subfamily C member 16-like [Pollicipes pollicipes]
MQNILVVLLICISVILPVLSWNPYDILMVDRQADVPAIKKSYKRLVKQWHPDKNTSPDAEERFVEINKAYEIVSDPVRRRRFDRTGQVEDTPNFRQSGRPFGRDDVASFASSQFHFSFRRHGTMLFHKQSISLRQYENKVLPSSRTSPTLLLAFSEWCFSCVQMEPVWASLTEELQTVGIGIATVHAEHERELARRLAVDTLPRLYLVLDGRAVRYAADTFSLAGVIDFIKAKMSPGLLPTLTPASMPAFLAGWADNRVRLVIYSQSDAPRLRYVALAYKFRASAASGFVCTSVAESAPLLAAYAVPARAETLHVLKESREAPAASLSMQLLPFTTMSDVVEKNKFLLLPRLSSQLMLDTLCPTEAARSRRHLCVVLVARSTEPQTERQAALRRHIARSRVTRDRLQYAYIYMDKQARFMDALRQGSSLEDAAGHVVILWRQDHRHVRFDWSEHRWETQPDRLNQSARQLEHKLHALLVENRVLAHAATVQDLIDEHAHTLLRRILNRLYHLWEYIGDRLSREEVLPAVSVLVTIVFLIAGGYLMAYLVRMEEETIRSRFQAEGRPPPARPAASAQLRVHEMRVETYNGLVRLLKPGCRTVVLLVDAGSKPNLLSRFHRIVWPYRKNKSLMFAFVMLERGLEWYRRLLIPSLPPNQQLKINPKNCIGTVLSINGYRKYFCMYHAKHAEAGGKAGVRRRRAAAKGGASGGGEFMGFDSNDSSSSDVEAGEKRERRTRVTDEVLFEEHLLDGLPDWLDRLFEGQTVRYHVKYWPDFSGK